jgi:hypothetical protein
LSEIARYKAIASLMSPPHLPHFKRKEKESPLKTLPTNVIDNNTVIDETTTTTTITTTSVYEKGDDYPISNEKTPLLSETNNVNTTKKAKRNATNKKKKNSNVDDNVSPKKAKKRPLEKDGHDDVSLNSSNEFSIKERKPKKPRKSETTTTFPGIGIISLIHSLTTVMLKHFL